MANPDKSVGRGRGRSSEVPFTESTELNRNSFVPLYYQLAEALKKMLETGAVGPGDRFPSEREIAEEFGVSRTVIRPALDLLVSDGAIVRIRGSGTFVAPPKRRVPILGLVKMLAERPDGLAVSVLTTSEESPGPAVKRFLDLGRQASSIAHVTAVIRVDGLPVYWLDSYCAGARVPWLLPLVAALKSGAKPPEPNKLDLTRATVQIEGTFFGRWGASQLGVSAGDPTLLGRLVQFGKVKGAKRERPIEFTRLIYASGSTQLSAEVR
jgi:DNA-binding GntR family transcriptional regulator